MPRRPPGREEAPWLRGEVPEAGAELKVPLPILAALQVRSIKFKILKQQKLISTPAPSPISQMKHIHLFS